MKKPNGYKIHVIKNRDIIVYLLLLNKGTTEPFFILFFIIFLLYFFQFCLEAVNCTKIKYFSPNADQ